ncbi:MAG: peptidoglycan DD-metalloendopeptidase family protein [Oscillospiraceae bacterium]|jgi:murein DD-endopeptidase MepM/ murein hydrolase activator NlpD|nr:peptidoglycan DD-metalloendopeptidase family protein [Oscillospiraceae bacterium]
MDEKKSLLQKIGSFVAGKGFYVILFACFATIGVSAYMLVHGGPQADTSAGTGGAAYEAAGQPQPQAPAYVPDYGGGTGDAQTQLRDTPAQGEEPAPPTQSGARAEPGGQDKAPAAAAESTPASAPDGAGELTGADGAGEDGDVAAAAAAKSLTFVWPLAGDIIFPYSIEELIYNKTMGDWRVHDGIDIAGGIGAKIVSAADGEVADILDDDLLGTTVVIDHGAGIVSRYSNLASVPAVKKGDKITMGAVIGSLGDTALGEAGEPAHLHFSMAKDGRSANPAEYLK